MHVRAAKIWLCRARAGKVPEIGIDYGNIAIHLGDVLRGPRQLGQRFEDSGAATTCCDFTPTAIEMPLKENSVVIPFN
jgi:hypothetical protein